jgi:hypothetical protein
MKRLGLPDMYFLRALAGPAVMDDDRNELGIIEMNTLIKEYQVKRLERLERTREIFASLHLILCCVLINTLTLSLTVSAVQSASQHV